ncbi:F-box only protein 6 [Canna indica]|uniref:F-box only protein 6 n=1 Tax=Canna indica TaxID=4628 RepID=A0AAQ3KWU6_9LILI|nr:F-box only protein 6 [Canna indica]
MPKKKARKRFFTFYDDDDDEEERREKREERREKTKTKRRRERGSGDGNRRLLWQGMDGAAMLRQLVGQIQELCELYGSPSIDQPHHLNPRWYIIDLNNNSLEYDFCGLKVEAKSDQKMVEANKSSPCKRSKREDSTKVVTSTSADLMDQKIWKDFPEDLLEAVIARLPIESFFRFRSICRKWNSLLTSNSFAQQFSEVPRLLPWFYSVTHENMSSGAVYDPSLRKWYHLSAPHLPAKMIILPVASAGGLICFLDLGHKKFYVCNPLTGSCKELPARSFRVWSRVAVGMILNGNSISTGYKIMWLGSNGDHEIYDSVQDRWTRHGSVPLNIKLPLSLNFRSQTVSIDSTLYFLHTEPDGVLSYNVENGVWKQFIIPSPLHLTDHTLAEYGGQVMLVGLVTKNAATCVYIWELQKMTLLWKEVDRMPNIWCLEFYGKHVRMTCLGNRGLLMLSLRSRRMSRLVTYNMSNKQWQKVPECLLPHCRKRQSIACGTAFHPCPTAFA